MLVKTSDKLKIRSLQETDWEVFHAVYSDEKTMRHIADPFDREYLEKDFQKKLAIKVDDKEAYHLMVVEDASQNKLGLCGYRFLADEASTAELGIMLLPQHLGPGLDAIKLLLRLAFEDLGIKKVIAQINPDNRAAIFIVNRLKFSLVRQDLKSSAINQEEKPQKLYELFRSDFIYSTSKIS